MAARKRWRRYIPDDEISVRAFLHLIGRLFYYVGLHSEYFLLNFGRGARAAVLALWHGVCWMLALGATTIWEEYDPRQMGGSARPLAADAQRAAQHPPGSA